MSTQATTRASAPAPPHSSTQVTAEKIATTAKNAVQEKKIPALAKNPYRQQSRSNRSAKMAYNLEA
jgi:hypothetical protein